jgi:hypothetical protein
MEFAVILRLFLLRPLCVRRLSLYLVCYCIKEKRMPLNPAINELRLATIWYMSPVALTTFSVSIWDTSFSFPCSYNFGKSFKSQRRFIIDVILKIYLPPCAT